MLTVEAGLVSRGERAKARHHLKLAISSVSEKHYPGELKHAERLLRLV